MIANVDNVIKWLEINNLDYWQVQLKDADNSNVFESDEAGFAANAKRFRDVMELCSGSRFFIKASQKKGINRGKFYEEFKNVPETPQVNGIPQLPQVGGITEDEVDRRVNAAISGLKMNMKMEALEAENKELKNLCKDHDNMTTRVLSKIEPYIGTLISGAVAKFMPASAPISMAGIERVECCDENEDPETRSTERETDVDQQRLEIALTKWQQADPDFISLIEAVSDLAATKDPMYAIAKGMLKK